MSEAFEKFGRLLDSGVRNLSQSFYDHYVEANAKFRSKAGLKVTIVREALGECCDWCSDLAGIYSYENAPDEIYARHRDCNCIVSTKTEKGTWQDAWSRKEYNSFKENRIEREQEIINENKLNNNRQKRIDISETLAYSNSPVNTKALMQIYDQDVADGWISPLSRFDNYLEQYQKIEAEIIGQRTSNGIEITEQSRHFMQRVLGTSRDPKILKEEHKVVSRSGVSVDSIKQALFEGEPLRARMGKDGSSQVFIGKKCKVTINPTTGKLIQCNPR